MISVITPYKDAAGWLGRCIASMIEQETKDIEFILVDDGSADGGADLARRMTESDGRFTLADNKHKAGVSGARNTGLDLAKGEWVTFIDSDDELVQNAAVIFGHMANLDGEPNIIQANHLRHYDSIQKTTLKYTNEAGWYNLDHLPDMWCMVWNKLYRRAFIEDNKIRFDEAMRYGEDEIFNLDCLAKDNRIRHTKRTTTTVTRHFDNEHSLTKSKNKNDLLKQANALERYLKRQSKPEAIRAACRILSEHWGSETYINGFGGAEEK